MDVRRFSRLAGVTAGALMAGAALVAAQGPSTAAAPRTPQAAAPARAWTVPRTPWGHPDFQGVWTNIGDYLTPFQRDPKLGTRTVLTEEEYQKRISESQENNEADGHIYFDTLVGQPGRRTSLVIDPPDGRMPPFTAEGQRRVDAAAALRKVDNVDNPATMAAFGVGERCITRTLTGAGAPRAYSNNRQFFQTRDNIVVVYEMFHDARIIPINGRPHVGRGIRDWMGDSRGRWEGDTLVVEATNFRDRMTFNGSPGTQNDIPVSDQLKITERYTRVNADTIQYTTTVDDPGTFTRPWTFMIEMKRDPTQTQILEFACHEGNKNVELGLRVARADEKKAQEKK